MGAETESGWPVRIGRGKRGALWLSLGVLFSAAGLALVARGLDWAALVDGMRQARMGWLLAAVGAELLSILVNAVRWRFLYGSHPHKGVEHLFGILSAAQLGNTILPGRPGPVVRALLAGGDGVSRATTVTTLVVEKVLEGMTLLPVAALLPVVLELPQGWRASAQVAGLVCLGMCLVLAAGSRWRRELIGLGGRLDGRWLSGVIGALLDGMDAVRSSRAGWRLWMLSWLYWATLTAVNWLLMRAVSLNVSLSGALVLLIGLQIGSRLPSSPASVGVFEYVGYLSLAAVGVDRTPAVGATLMLHLVMSVPASLAGVLYLLWIGGGARLRACVQ